jgi:type IV secretory pathway VirB2 component (pilin)
MKKRFALVGGVLPMLLPSLAMAGADFMEKFNDKGNELIEILTGQFAIIVATIVICIAGYMFFTGKAAKSFCLCIIGGTLLISLSAQIAKWLFS